jgi:hypothetical protein
MDILQTNKHLSFLPKQITWAGSSRQLLLLYVFTMPFVSGFAITGTISAPLIIAVLLLLGMAYQVIRGINVPKGFWGYDILIIGLFLFQVLLSFLLNGFGHPKSLNHTIAYLASFLLFFIVIKFTLFFLADSGSLLKKILLVLTILTFVNSLYTNVEFILDNFFGINLNDYIPRPTANEMFYDAGVLSMFHRARGFASESGSYTAMVEIFFPLAIYYMFFSGWCKWSSIFKTVIVLLTISSLIFAASTATFIIIPICFTIALLFHFKRIGGYLLKNKRRYFLIGIVVCAICWLINHFLSVFYLIYLSVIEKMDSGSFDERQAKIDFFYIQYEKLNTIDKFVGAGPAGFSTLGFDESKSIVSLYYNIIFETGIVGIVLLVLFILYHIILAASIKSGIGFFLLISTLSGAMHYFFYNNYWLPWYWFVLALVSLIYFQQVYIKNHNTAPH